MDSKTLTGAFAFMEKVLNLVAENQDIHDVQILEDHNGNFDLIFEFSRNQSKYSDRIEVEVDNIKDFNDHLDTLKEIFDKAETIMK